LKAAVESDCNRGEGCFNPEGCDKSGPIKCFHRYCDKFKWVIDRMDHYSQKTGIPPEDLLDRFEEKRDYWYMNYYQESQQPKIDGDSIEVRVFETFEDYRESIGKIGFRCPRCERISNDPVVCDQPGCDWKAYGLFGTLGKGVSVFVKDGIHLANIFKPVAWEEQVELEA